MRDVSGPVKRGAFPAAWRTILSGAVAMAVIGAALPVAAAEETITIGPAGLDVPQLEVATGTSVTWVNQDGDRHRIRTQSGPVDFDSGNLDPGARFTFVFDTPGTYSYLDDRNRDNTAYHGSITVSSAPGSDGTSGGTGGGTGGAAAGSGDVTMAGRVFTPASITIAAGGTVNFVNNDGRDHTVTARDGSFDSGIMAPGQAWSRTFADPGTYAYFCALHPDMVGTVTVTDAAGNAPPPVAPPATQPASSPPAVGPGAVTIFDFGYTPADASIPAGTTVTFTNTGAALHTVTDRAGSFDSGLISAGSSWSRKFSTPGTFNIFCTLHPEMVATLRVTDASGAAPPPAPAAPTSAPTLGRSTTSTGAGVVSMTDNRFSPETTTVRAGTTVRWVNDGAAIHTATARDGSFDSGLRQPGQTYSRTFDTPGTYEYFCVVHPTMTGTIVVTDASGSAPPPVTATGPGPEEAGSVLVGAPGAVSIGEDGFTPGAITIVAGTRVAWTNDTNGTHAVAADDGSFDSGMLIAGRSWSLLFDTPGTFAYHDRLDPTKTGTVIVTAAASSAPSSEPKRVAMLDFEFQPRDLTVAVGTEITWVNQGVAPHTVTDRGGAFDSGLVQVGESWSRAFDDVGAFEYFCTLHPDMVGTVTVVEATAEVAGTIVSLDSADVSGGAIAASEQISGGAGHTAVQILLYGLIAAVMGAVVMTMWGVKRMLFTAD